MPMSDSVVMDILKKKGTNVETARKTDSAMDALKKMNDKGVGCLVVFEKEKIAGIITERDYTRKVAIPGEDPASLNVENIMTSKVIYVCDDEKVDNCMAIMTEQRIRHLPVVCDDKLIGLVSIGDLIKQFSHDQRATIKYLEDYITGSYPA